MRAFVLLIGVALLAALPSAPSAAAKLGETCDGMAALKCKASLWCEHPAGECSVADGAGTCVKESGAFCAAIFQPVCGCDGKTYGNDCERQMAMVSKDRNGACRTPKM